MSLVNRPPPGTLAVLPTPTLVVLVALAWVSAVAFPLATYTLTLALFGLAHVACELAWLWRRFGGWLGRLLVPLGVLLLGIASLRAAALVGAVPRSAAHGLELLAGALLVLVVAPRWLRGPLRTRAAGLALTCLLVGGVLLSPVHVLLLVAVLHNWTPVALLAEALEPRYRPRLYRVAAVVFGGLPLLIASGLPWGALASGGLGSVDLGLPHWGPLSAHEGAYLPPELRGWGGAQHLFSAIVFAQCLHYVAVIGVLPRVGPELRPVPGWRALVLAGTAALFVAYLVDFRLARSTYGVVASVHAWVEVPLLVLALLPPASRTPPSVALAALDR